MSNFRCRVNDPVDGFFNQPPPLPPCILCRDNTVRRQESSRHCTCIYVPTTSPYTEVVTSTQNKRLQCAPCTCPVSHNCDPECTKQRPPPRRKRCLCARKPPQLPPARTQEYQPPCGGVTLDYSDKYESDTRHSNVCQHYQYTIEQRSTETIPETDRGDAIYSDRFPAYTDPPEPNLHSLLCCWDPWPKCRLPCDPCAEPPPEEEEPTRDGKKKQKKEGKKKTEEEAPPDEGKKVDKVVETKKPIVTQKAAQTPPKGPKQLESIIERKKSDSPKGPSPESAKSVSIHSEPTVQKVSSEKIETRKGKSPPKRVETPPSISPPSSIDTPISKPVSRTYSKSPSQPRSSSKSSVKTPSKDSTPRARTPSPPRQPPAEKQKAASPPKSTSQRVIDDKPVSKQEVTRGPAAEPEEKRSKQPSKASTIKSPSKTVSAKTPSSKTLSIKTPSIKSSEEKPQERKAERPSEKLEDKPAQKRDKTPEKSLERTPEKSADKTPERIKTPSAKSPSLKSESVKEKSVKTPEELKTPSKKSSKTSATSERSKTPSKKSDITIGSLHDDVKVVHHEEPKGASSTSSLTCSSSCDKSVCTCRGDICDCPSEIPCPSDCTLRKPGKDKKHPEKRSGNSTPKDYGDLLCDCVGSPCQIDCDKLGKKRGLSPNPRSANNNYPGGSVKQKPNNFEKTYKFTEEPNVWICPSDESCDSDCANVDCVNAKGKKLHSKHPPRTKPVIEKSFEADCICSSESHLSSISDLALTPPTSRKPRTLKPGGSTDTGDIIRGRTPEQYSDYSCICPSDDQAASPNYCLHYSQPCLHHSQTDSASCCTECGSCGKNYSTLCKEGGSVCCTCAPPTRSCISENNVQLVHCVTEVTTKKLTHFGSLAKEPLSQKAISKIKTLTDNINDLLRDSIPIRKNDSTFSSTISGLRVALEQFEQMCRNKLASNSHIEGQMKSVTVPKEKKFLQSKSILDIKEIRRIGPDSLLIKWVTPQQTNVTGYEVIIDGELKSNIFSKARTCAVIDGIDLHAVHDIEIYGKTQKGRYKIPAVYFFDPVEFSDID